MNEYRATASPPLPLSSRNEGRFGRTIRRYSSKRSSAGGGRESASGSGCASIKNRAREGRIMLMVVSQGGRTGQSEGPARVQDCGTVDGVRAQRVLSPTGPAVLAPRPV